MNEDAFYEVVRGRRREAPPPRVPEACVVSVLTPVLGFWVRKESAGRVIAYALFDLAETDTMRRPDMAFVSAARWGLNVPVPRTNAWNVVPNLAVEVARQIPTGTVAASADESLAIAAQGILSSPYFRVYRSSDIVGVELGGALKNVLAIGAGISDGLGYGDNTKAVLVTRGLVEVIRLGEALGAQPRTFMGLSGVGDLMATCASRLSRNLRVGMALGQGMSPAQALDEVKQVAEGVPTAKAAYNLAAAHGIYAPITEQIYKVLFEGRSCRDSVTDLMQRETKQE